MHTGKRFYLAVCLFSPMNHPMIPQVTCGDKPFLALITTKGFLSGVASGVNDKTVFTCKGLCAMHTDERFFLADNVFITR
jgi:hypothetical protein